MLPQVVKDAVFSKAYSDESLTIIHMILKTNDPSTVAVMYVIPDVRPCVVSSSYSNNSVCGFIQVQAAVIALKQTDELPMPPGVDWSPDLDMLDWLGGFFGFQV